MLKRLFIAAACAVGVVLPVMAAGTLSPAEIKSTFATGKPFSASSLGGKVFAMTFNLDGSALAVPKGGKKGQSGTWHASDKGYCTKWGKSPEHCYTVAKNGKRFDVLDASGKLTAHWTL
jgi:hypothetical protein